MQKQRKKLKLYIITFVQLTNKQIKCCEIISTTDTKHYYKQYYNIDKNCVYEVFNKF